MKVVHVDDNGNPEDWVDIVQPIETHIFHYDDENIVRVPAARFNKMKEFIERHETRGRDKEKNEMESALAGRFLGILGNAEGVGFTRNRLDFLWNSPIGTLTFPLTFRFGPKDATSAGWNMTGTKGWQRGVSFVGMEEPLKRLEEGLGRDRLGHDFYPEDTAFMLFGRKGSGKSSLLCHEQLGLPVLGDSFVASNFDILFDWTMQPWNWPHFPAWVDNCINVVTKGVHEAYRILFLIKNIDELHSLQSSPPENALMKLIAFTKTKPRFLKVLVTSNTTPGKFHGDLLRLFDSKIYAGLPKPADRTRMVKERFAAFKRVCEKTPELKDVTWSVTFDSDDVSKDPDHIINTIVTCSADTTPAELHEFMMRIFQACRYPKPDGSTEICDDFINKLFYDVEGVKCIVPYNPTKWNKEFFDYVHQDPECTSQDTRMCIIGASRAKDDEEDEALVNDVRLQQTDIEAEMDKPLDKSKKRGRVNDQDQQPMSVQEALAKRIADQEERLRKGKQFAKSKPTRQVIDDSSRNLKTRKLLEDAYEAPRDEDQDEDNDDHGIEC